MIANRINVIHIQGKQPHKQIKWEQGLNSEKQMKLFTVISFKKTKKNLKHNLIEM